MSFVWTRYSLAMIVCAQSGLIGQEPENKKNPCDNPITTSEMRDCAWSKFKQADAEMNEVYNTLMNRIDDPGHKLLLKKAQKAWLAYRDSVAEFEAYFFNGGSAKEQIKAYALARLTINRTTELKETLKNQFDR